MPAARGVKRAASKATSVPATASPPVPPKNKKKRGPIQLELPKLPSTKGQVFTCGQNDVGQLGLGEDVSETSRFKFVSLLGVKIASVQAGGMHTVALDSDGKVWTFGCNDEGALGRATAGDDEEGSPATVPLPSRAVTVSAGDSHTAALLDDGTVYLWGAFRDSHGSMGLLMSGREGKSSRSPVLVTTVGEPAVAIASGQDHLAILTASGSIFTLGCGEQGQLGRLSQRSASREARAGFSALLTPSKVNLKVGASRIWAGYHATFALDASGEKMYAFGLNNYGQLGITGEKYKSAIFTPIECDAFNTLGRNWKGVACGQHHTVALDTEGVVYTVGRCEYGRLGLGDRVGDAETLLSVPKLSDKKCVCVAAGTSNSFAVTEGGELFAWGMGSEGQLGTGKSADCDSPTPAAPLANAGLQARLLSAGGQHTVLLAEDPSRPKSPSPAPERETVEEKTDEVPSEDDADQELKPKPSKRQRKQLMDDEVSSTSGQSTATKGKVNGDEKIDNKMEVDETDNAPSKDKTNDQSTNEPTINNDTKMDQDTLPDEKTQSENIDKTPETKKIEQVNSNTEQVTPIQENSEDVDMTEKTENQNGVQEQDGDVKIKEKICPSDSRQDQPAVTA